MEFSIEDLNKNEQFEKKISYICSFNNAKCDFIQGRVLNVNNTNISFVEPHKIIINIKGKDILLIYIDENNLFLFNRTIPITTKELDNLLKEIRKGTSNHGN